MAVRANWKGVLKIGEVSCPIALYTAASTAERITFHILNRKTGHRVHREFVDAETGERVEAKQQVKGYEIGTGDYIAFDPEEIAKAVPEADKTLDVKAFVPCDQVDDAYFDRPYYLAPSALPRFSNRAKTLSCSHQYLGECPPDEAEIHAVSMACHTTVGSHR